MITDYVKLLLKAGDGGNGCVAFRREKYVAYGGPSGGDGGGKGGDIILTVDDGANTLLAYRYRRKFIAQNGEDGKSKNATEQMGPTLFCPFRPRTLVARWRRRVRLYMICPTASRLSFAVAERAVGATRGLPHRPARYQGLRRLAERRRKRG